MNCTFPTRVQYVYMPEGGKDFKPLSDTTTLPADVAKTTTLTGVTVPFVVRVETGAMNRGIYQNTILHDPTKDPAPTPFTPPPAWNRRLIAVHGTGCPTGWYRQGGAMGVTVERRAAQGYAIPIHEPPDEQLQRVPRRRDHDDGQGVHRRVRRATVHGESRHVRRRLHEPAGRRRVSRTLRRGSRYLPDALSIARRPRAQLLSHY